MKQQTNNQTWQPKTDIMELENGYSILMEMPGVEKEDLAIRVEKDKLYVEGILPEAPETSLKSLYREFRTGNYARSFQLSEEVNRDDIQAKFEDGLLQLFLSKVPARQPQKIQID